MKPLFSRSRSRTPSRIPAPVGATAALASFTLLFGCNPEGDLTMPVGEVQPDPCYAADANLSTGIEDGDDLMAIFECLNRDGQLDAFSPVVEAMYSSTISDGKTTVLTLWAQVLNQEVEKAQSAGLTVEVADLVPLVDSLLETLNEPWLPQALSLGGDVLASGTVEGAIPLLGGITARIVEMSPEKYDRWTAQLTTLLCPEGGGEGEPCQGDAALVYRALMELSASYDPAQPASYPLPSGEAVADLLAELLGSYGKDVEANKNFNLPLAQGIQRLSASPFLYNTLGQYVPALYGDDLETDELESGYESMNANQSALYGVLNGMNDPELFQQMGDMMDGLGPLLDSYYVWDNTKTGNAISARAGSCEPASKSSWSGAGDFEDDNPAHFGFAQFLRLLKALNISYKKNAFCQTAIEDLVLPLMGEGYELSGSTTIATLLLELSAQMPLNDVIVGTDALALFSQRGLDALLNNTCGAYLLADDVEALQKTVHMPDVIEPTMKFFKIITHAGKVAVDEQAGAGQGGMETVVQLMIDLYDSQLACDARPWLAETLVPGNVLGQQTDTLKAFLPVPGSVPGSSLHDKLVIPLLRVLMELRGNKAQTLLEPVVLGLEGSSDAMANTLTGLGQLGYQARKAAANGETPALYEMNSLLKELSAYDPNYLALGSVKAVVEEEILLRAFLETLGSRPVAEALGMQGVEGEAPVATLAAFVQDGRLESILGMIRELLTQLQSTLENQSSQEEGARHE